MKNENIFNLIKTDHRKVGELFTRIERTTEKSTQTRERLYNALRTELTHHAEAEEKALYPSLRVTERTLEIGYEGTEEHSLIKFLLSKLDATPTEAHEFIARITTLREIVEHHVKEEEMEMFPKMKKAFTKEELDYIANAFVKAKASLKGKVIDLVQKAA